MAAQRAEQQHAASRGPRWFRDAVDRQPERELVHVAGAEIEFAAWGKRGAPGLLLIPGNGAHIGWWAFLAPFFADTHRVATFSFSGMGGSEWRKLYEPGIFAQEALSVAEAAGLFDFAAKPIVVGHSFGAFIAMVMAGLAGERLGAVVNADSRLRPTARWRIAPDQHRQPRIHATRAEALKTFHLAPVQETENDYIVQWLAPASLGPAPGGAGWTWRADPNLRTKSDLGDTDGLIAKARCPLAFIRGGRSLVTTGEIWEQQRAEAEPDTLFVEIPEAGHHLMVDQPIALVAVLRLLLAALG